MYRPSRVGVHIYGTMDTMLLTLIGPGLIDYNDTVFNSIQDRHNVVTRDE